MNLKEENEKLRELLRRAKWKLWTSPGDTLRAEIEATLSHKADHNEDVRAMVEPAPAQTEQRPSATQQILDLILEQCRYWHGRDEARRGGFACLYAAAKEVADNASPVSQPAQTELVEALERARSNFRITLEKLNGVPEGAWSGRLDRAHQYTTQGLQLVEQSLANYRAALAAQDK